MALAWTGKAASQHKRQLFGRIGGAKRDRTADLLHAMQALSQLSYGPTPARKAGAVSGSIPARMGGAPVFDGGF